MENRFFATRRKLIDRSTAAAEAARSATLAGCAIQIAVLPDNEAWSCGVAVIASLKEIENAIAVFRCRASGAFDSGKNGYQRAGAECGHFGHQVAPKKFELALLRTHTPRRAGKRLQSRHHRPLAQPDQITR